MQYAIVLQTYDQIKHLRQASFSSDAYHITYAVRTTDAKLVLKNSAARLAHL